MKIKMLLGLFFLPFYGFGMESDTIQVPFDKTVYMYFDGLIVDSDFGHPDLIGEIKGNKLILRSAVGKGFPETNMNIETESGVYVFVCVFRKNPNKLVYKLSVDDATIVFNKKEVVYEDGKEIESTESNNNGSTILPAAGKRGSVVSDMNKNFIKDCEYLLNKRNEVHELGVESNKLVFSLGNMFVNDKYMYFKVDMKNMSYIKYDIDFFKFVVRNKKGNIRKNAVQDEEKLPVFVYNKEVKVVDGKEMISKVFVFGKFTMDPKENFHFEIWEVLGDRKVEFKVPSSNVLSMKKLY